MFGLIKYLVMGVGVVSLCEAGWVKSKELLDSYIDASVEAKLKERLNNLKIDGDSSGKEVLEENSKEMSEPLPQI